MARLFWCVLAVLATLSAAEASKILVVFPLPSKSHGILGAGIVELLLQAGHEVTFISPFSIKNDNPNFHQVITDEIKEFIAMINLKDIMDKKTEVNDMGSFFPMNLNLSISTLNHKNVQKMLHDPNINFDLIILEWMFNDVFAGLSAVYNCPFIWFSSVEPHSLVLSLIDEHMNPAYNPSILSDNIPPFSFKQRVQELMNQIIIGLLKKFYLGNNEKKTYEAIFGPIFAKKGEPFVPYDVMIYNASLLLGNSHVSLGKASSLPQSYKSVGGFHIDPEVKALPQDLKKLLDGAKDGVIYFSMGSNIKSKDWPDEVKRSLLKMFGGLKYTVIWKFEEILLDLPKNVHILQWAPQPSILAHPNCRLFVTHGGLLSTTETIHFGVPIIGIPVFADQFGNVNLAVNKGFAKKVDLTYNLAEDLKITIEEILGDPKYTAKVKELSFIYHHRPVPPGKELVHWVEHVIQTRGALHLRSPALLVPWYQKMYLDLLGLVLIILYLLKLVLCKIFSKAKSVTSAKKKN